MDVLNDRTDGLNQRMDHPDMNEFADHDGFQGSNGTME